MESWIVPIGCSRDLKIADEAYSLVRIQKARSRLQHLFFTSIRCSFVLPLYVLVGSSVESSENTSNGNMKQILMHQNLSHHVEYSRPNK
jgi:hypothetical protein